MSNLVHNERIKLRATYLNNFAVALVIGAFLIPALSFSQLVPMWKILTTIGIGAVTSFVIHLLAIYVLKDLRE
jgi:hypothetical protein